MREILGVGDEAPLSRRWFHDDYFDLFVWQDAGGAVARFELCYGAGASERALVWLGDERLFHDGAPGAAPGLPKLLQRFERAGAGLPERVRREVHARVRELGTRRTTRRSGFRRAPWQQRGAQSQPRSG
jgi:hypothetical protein